MDPNNPTTSPQIPPPALPNQPENFQNMPAKKAIPNSVAFGVIGAVVLIVAVVVGFTAMQNSQIPSEVSNTETQSLNTKVSSILAGWKVSSVSPGPSANFEVYYPQDWASSELSFPCPGVRDASAGVIKVSSSTGNYLVQFCVGDTNDVIYNGFIKIPKSGNIPEKVFLPARDLEATREYKIAESIIENSKLIFDSGVSVRVGWQTYRNDQYGFEFRHPTNHVVSLSKHVPPHGADLILPNGNLIIQDGSIGKTLNFWVFQSPLANFDQYVTDDVENARKINNSSLDQQGNPPVKITYKNLLINNVPAYQVRYEYTNSSQEPVNRIYIQNAEHVFIFRFSDDFDTEAQRILSTFKFIK